jgi:hypothetical protein
MYQFWVSATEARVDMVFTACVTASIAGFFFWQRDGRNGGRRLAYLAAACAVLAKGPVGAVLPGIVIVSFLVVERRFAAIWQFISWPLIVLALAIDLGWYALAYRIGGSEFLAWQIMHENVDQLLGTHGFESNKTTLSMLGWIPTRTFPWNLALVWMLVRRLRGERQDSTGRFLAVWWAAITAFFFLVNVKRAVYLLPTYPAIALLAARALAAMTARVGQYSRGDSGDYLPLRSALARIARTPARLAVAIALVDLALILPNPTVWKREMSYQPMLAFVREVEAAVPGTRPLFAASELGSPTLMVVAYRLERTVRRKPISCAEPNDYFLVPLKAVDPSGAEMRILASSKRNNVALVRVLATPRESCEDEKNKFREKDQDDSD